MVVTEPPIESKAKTSSGKKSKKSKGDQDKKGKRKKKSASPAAENLIPDLDREGAEVVTTSGGLLDLGMGTGELGQQQATSSFKLLAEDTNLVMVRNGCHGNKQCKMAALKRALFPSFFTCANCLAVFCRVVLLYAVRVLTFNYVHVC